MAGGSKRRNTSQTPTRDVLGLEHPQRKTQAKCASIIEYVHNFKFPLRHNFIVVSKGHIIFTGLK